MPRVYIIGWSRSSMDTLPCATHVCAKDFFPTLWRNRPRPSSHIEVSLCAVEDCRQTMGVRAFTVPGTTRRGETVGERENVPCDQEVFVLGANRMPIDTIGRDSDFRHKISAGKRDAFFRKTPQRYAADDAILFADLPAVQELSELGFLGLGRDGRGESHPKSLRPRPLDTLPRFCPTTSSTMSIMALRCGTVEADLQRQAVTRQIPQDL